MALFLIWIWIDSTLKYDQLLPPLMPPWIWATTPPSPPDYGSSSPLQSVQEESYKIQVRSHCSSAPNLMTSHFTKSAYNNPQCATQCSATAITSLLPLGFFHNSQCCFHTKHRATSGPLHWLFPGYLHDLLPQLIQVFTQMPPSQWACSCRSYIKRQISSSPYFLLIHSNTYFSAGLFAICSLHQKVSSMKAGAVLCFFKLIGG